MHLNYLKHKNSGSAEWNKKRYDSRVLYRQRHCRLVAYYKNKPCADCKGWYPSYVMHFDHKNPAEKKFTIGDNMTKATKTLINEILKCEVVCANCHAERTHKLMVERKYPHKPFNSQIA